MNIIYVRLPVRLPGFRSQSRTHLFTSPSASLAHRCIAFSKFLQVKTGRSFSLGPSIRCVSCACCLSLGSKSSTLRRRTYHFSCFVRSINRFRTAYSEFFLQFALTPSQCRFDILRSVGSGASRCFLNSGNVLSTALPLRQSDGRSMGFGFVEMASKEEARKAVQMFNKKEIRERKISVNLARPRTASFIKHPNEQIYRILFKMKKYLKK